MDSNVWVTAITAIILAVIAFIFSSFSDGRLGRPSGDGVYEFRPSKWALGLALVSGSISFCFFWIPYSYQAPDFNSYVWVWFICGGIGTIWLALNLYWFFKVKSSYCIIYKDSIELKYGQKVRTADLSEIQNVNQVYYDIWLLTNGRKKKLKIPMIFKGSHNMLGILRQRIGNSEEIRS